MRLFRLLDHGKDFPVTWICGPPGCGKTLLVSSYLTAGRLRPLWYRFDESDIDLATLFQYLSWAAPARGEVLPIFTQEYQREFLVFARNYFRKLFVKLKAPFVLVFDDYQQVPDDGVMHAVIGVAAAELPEAGRIVIVSREEPPAAFARLRAHQQLHLLGWSDLQFTLSEALALSGEAPRAAIEVAFEMTHGWAAGLVLLMAQPTQQTEAISAAVAANRGLLFDYFAGEIFKKTPPAIQDFLLQTAFLPSIAVTAAEELTGNRTAANVLLGMKRSNYFIQHSGGGTTTFRYHPLFREFLLAQSRAKFSLQRLHEIHVHAAGIVDRLGEHDMAAQLLLDGHCWEEFSTFIVRRAETLLQQGRQHLLTTWIAQLPAAMLSQPALLYWRGMAMLSSAPQTCYLDFERAFHLYREQGDVAGCYLSWAFLVCAYHFNASTCALSDRWMSLLEDLMREHPFPTPEIEVLVSGAMICALAYRKPHPAQMAPWVARWQQLKGVSLDPAMRMCVLSFQVVYHTQLAQFTSARAVALEAIALAKEPGGAADVIAMANMTNAWYALYTGSSAERRMTIDEAIEYLRVIGLRGAQWHVLLCLGAFAALSDEDLMAARPYLEQLELDREQYGVGIQCWHESFMVRKALLLDDIEQARQRQLEMRRLSELSGSPRMQLSTELLSAQVFHLCHEADEARACIDRIYALAAELSNPFFEFSVRLVDAQLLLENGPRAEGIELLRQAMALGRRHHIMHTHNWRRSVMTRLCQESLSAEIEPEYVRELIELRNLSPDRSTFDAMTWPWPVRVNTLGTFAVFKNGVLLEWHGKAPRKPLALLKAIIAFGARKVPEHKVLDLLWPDLEGPQARFALKTALYRLRSLLGSQDAVLRENDTLELNPRRCWLDLWAIELSLAEPARDKLPASANPTALGPAVALCNAQFLDDNDVAWPTHYVDGLKRKVSRHLNPR